MTWEEFDRHCAIVMPKYYAATVDHDADGHHNSVTLTVDGQRICTTAGCFSPSPTHHQALVQGMNVVRRALQLRKQRLKD